MTMFSSHTSTRRSRPCSFVPQLETLEDRCVPAKIVPPLTPVIFVPGQPASLPSDFIASANAQDVPAATAALNNFLTHLGTDPDNLTSLFDLDPLPGVPGTNIPSPTNDLVKSLTKQGYKLGVNLFVAAHDWRLPIAPPEQGADRADDGILKIGTTLDNTNEVFDTGLDYMAYWLHRAAEAWLAQTGQPLQKVDIIAHSEGTLLTRAYISSTLYGGTYVDGDGSIQLPEVRRWVSLGSPNTGVSGIYNLLKGNFNNSLGTSEDGSGLYPFVQLAYLALTNLDQDIIAPDGSVLFDADDPPPDPKNFVQQWIPSIRAEMATYGFLDNGMDANNDPLVRNDFLLDVNAVSNFFGDPAGFVTRLQSLDLIYGTGLPTLSQVVTKTGTGGQVLELTTDPLQYGVTRPTAVGETWYQDTVDGVVPFEGMKNPKNGDSVLATLSAEQLFKQNPHANVKLHPQPAKKITHNAEVSNHQMNKLVIKILKGKK